MHQRDYYNLIAAEIQKLPGFEAPAELAAEVKEQMVTLIARRARENETFFDEDNFPKLKAEILENIRKTMVVH